MSPRRDSSGSGVSLRKDWKESLFSRPPPLRKGFLPQHCPCNPQIRNKPSPAEHSPEPQNPRSAGCRGIWDVTCSVNLVWFVRKKNWLPDVDNCENLLVHTSFPLSPTTRESPSEPAKRRLRASTAVSMAFEFQRLLSTKTVRNQADLARRFDLSRARVTQVLAILKLPPPVVDYLASLFHDERAKYNERELRRILALPTEAEQVEAFEVLRQAVGAQAGRGTGASGIDTDIGPVR